MLLTVGQLVTLFLVYGTVFTLRRGSGIKPSAAIYMLCGVWFSGPVLMKISLMFYGQPFLDPDEPHQILWLLLFTAVPMYTFIMSTYYGSLLALLAATALMIGAHFWLELPNYVLPPSQKALRKSVTDGKES